MGSPSIGRHAELRLEPGAFLVRPGVEELDWTYLKPGHMEPVLPAQGYLPAIDRAA